MEKKKYDTYDALAKRHSPGSHVGRDLLCAFCVGGAICTLGQLLHDLYQLRLHMSADNAALMTSVTLIALSALATGIGVYDTLARRAGAGTLVPITGFANAVVSPALEFKNEGYVLGVGAKMFIIAGPVIVYGAAASVLAGLITSLIK